MSWLENAYPSRTCGLHGFRIVCRGRLHLHHLISKGDAQGNDAIRALLDCNPPELTEFVCEAHHSHERWADTKEGQRILWRRKAEEFGEPWMEFILDSINALYKVPRPEMRLKALLGK